MALRETSHIDIEQFVTGGFFGASAYMHSAVELSPGRVFLHYNNLVSCLNLAGGLSLSNEDSSFQAVNSSVDHHGVGKLSSTRGVVVRSDSLVMAAETSPTVAAGTAYRGHSFPLNPSPFISGNLFNDPGQARVIHLADGKVLHIFWIDGTPGYLAAMTYVFTGLALTDGTSPRLSHGITSSVAYPNDELEQLGGIGITSTRALVIFRDYTHLRAAILNEGASHVWTVGSNISLYSDPAYPSYHFPNPQLHDLGSGSYLLFHSAGRWSRLQVSGSTVSIAASGALPSSLPVWTSTRLSSGNFVVLQGQFDFFHYLYTYSWDGSTVSQVGAPTAIPHGYGLGGGAFAAGFIPHYCLFANGNGVVLTSRYNTTHGSSSPLWLRATVFGGVSPPLRQRQRNDEIRQRSPRNSPSSRQSSIRKGWQGTYH